MRSPPVADKTWPPPPLSPLVGLSQRPSDAEQFGQLVGEYVSLIGKAFGNIENFICKKYKELPSNSLLKTKIQKIETFAKHNEKTILISIKYIGALFCLWQSPLVFTIAMILGIWESYASFPIDIPVLKKGKLFSEKGCCMTMFFLGLANWYLGTHLLEDAFWAGLAGTIAGNAISNDSKQKLEEKFPNIQNFTNNLPFLQRFFRLFPSSPPYNPQEQELRDLTPPSQPPQE